MAKVWMKFAAVAAVAAMACSASAFASQLTAGGELVSAEAAAQMQEQAQKTIQALKRNPSLVNSSWQLKSVWFCTMTANVSVVDVYTDHTFYSHEAGYTGTWEQTKKGLVVTYNTGTVYTGKLITSTHAEGTMVAWNGVTGCWTADRL